VTPAAYESWLNEVEEALSSINMSMEDWQTHWLFDFRHEFEAGTAASDAATKANQYWWQRQNKAIGQDCRKTPDCWLPRSHQGKCEPLKIDVVNEHPGESE
jgi:hypothetical protein